MLSIRRVEAWYGQAQVLRGVDLDIGEGDAVALLGRNGSGRSTLVKAIAGHVRRRGLMRFHGRDISASAPHEIARAGIGWVPEERCIFSHLTVRQNLSLGRKPRRHGGRWSEDELLAMFPNLAARADALAGALSGGEQQMLAMGRTLLGDPSLVLVDEPTEGLSPAMTSTIGSLVLEMRRRGLAVLLVEQRLALAPRTCTRFVVMGHGTTVFEGGPEAFRDAHSVRREWLEV